ncbi:MAG: VOC family protein [Porticoccaceae bacterium]
MLSYVTLGTNDLQRAGKFYDELLSVVGGKRAWESDRFIGWAGPTGGTMMMLMKPFNEQPSTSGNGVMMALAAESPEQVKAIYDKAISLGATDEGEPGPRGDAFHCGYFRDLDGNKFNAFYMPQG